MGALVALCETVRLLESGRLYLRLGPCARHRLPTLRVGPWSGNQTSRLAPPARLTEEGESELRLLIRL
jgi:hypothetical protein